MRFCVLSQDLLALSDKYNGRPAAEETINDPTERKHYWRYRCHIDLETLLEDKAFLLDIQQMLLGEFTPISSLCCYNFVKDHISDAILLHCCI